MAADWDCIVRTLVRVEMAGSGPGHDGRASGQWYQTCSLTERRFS
jgi:hypothetical protein